MDDTTSSSILVCGICQDTLHHDHHHPYVVSLPCHHTHVFHSSCILEWCMRDPVCPFDRTPIPTHVYLPDFKSFMFRISRSECLTLFLAYASLPRGSFKVRMVGFISSFPSHYIAENIIKISRTTNLRWRFLIRTLSYDASRYVIMRLFRVDPLQALFHIFLRRVILSTSSALLKLMHTNPPSSYVNNGNQININSYSSIDNRLMELYTKAGKPVKQILAICSVSSMVLGVWAGKYFQPKIWPLFKFFITRWSPTKLFVSFIAIYGLPLLGVKM
eukprot:TRINITY_DN10187_c0_g1_i1.p1 TRINITY_DN10187_c0_g1~~TRINITY_DN10187_c0_g1_i1.p1  ORF type:complete len:274 (-),score=39.51 TRINITY_DN10187_c0_g1_i1:294-1115(-)